MWYTTRAISATPIARTATDVVSEPTRPLLLGTFEDGTGYAYNLARPGGVKYLRRSTLTALQELIDESGNPPTLPVRSGAVHNALSAAGLVGEGLTLSPSTERRPARTMTVWFHIANACNLSCAYCYIPNLVKAADEQTRAKYLMASSDVEKAVEQMFDACAQMGFRGLQIKFAGGEPTLNADTIERACALARQRSAESGIAIGFRILTNGVFDPDRMIPIFTANAFGVSISVDGEPEEHDRIRFLLRRSGDPSGSDRIKVEKVGTWTFIEANIAALQAAGLKPYLLCTVTENNLPRLRKLVAFCRDRQIGFRLSPVRDRATYGRPGLQAEFAAVLSQLYSEIGATYPTTMPIERFARFAEWNLATPKDIACGSCRSMLAVDERGNVSSCQMRLNAPVGSIRTTPLSTLFDRIRSAPEHEYMVAPERKTGACVQCDYRYVCAGGCPEHTRAVTGTTNAPSPWCDLYTMLLPAYVRAVATQIKRGVDARLAAASL